MDIVWIIIDVVLTLALSVFFAFACWDSYQKSRKGLVVFTGFFAVIISLSLVADVLYIFGVV